MQAKREAGNDIPASLFGANWKARKNAPSAFSAGPHEPHAGEEEVTGDDPCGLKCVLSSAIRCSCRSLDESYGIRDSSAETFCRLWLQWEAISRDPNGGEFLGLEAYQNPKEITDKVDLAIVSVPAQAVADVLQDCIERKIEAAEVLSAGQGQRK